MTTHPLAADLSKQASSLNGRRKNFWEPIYTDATLASFDEFDWHIEDGIGILRKTCKADKLKEYRIEKPRSVIENFIFREYDFVGNFDFGNFTFKKCEFENCDLGRSTWRNIKFQECTFKRCSLTQSTLDSCKFIECSWSEIGLSGNETIIKECSITNPSKFISSAYANLNDEFLKNQKKPTNASYQLMRLEQSKLKVARLLLKSLEHYGSDDEYYEAVKTYLNQGLSAKLAEVDHNFYEKKNFKYLISKGFLKLEKIILNTSGFLNDWGKSAAKPALAGCMIVILFALIYKGSGIQKSLFDGIIASLDVTTLVGYTKHANISSSTTAQALYMANMIIGLYWYAIFVPTVINRISRVRG